MFWPLLALVTIVFAAAITQEPRLLLVPVVLIVLGFALPRPRALVFLAGLTLPWASVLALPIPGVRIALADVLAMLSIVAVLALKSARTGGDFEIRHSPFLAIARPVKPWLTLAAVYTVVAALATTFSQAAAPSLTSYGEAFQRAEILIVWILLGVLVAHRSLLPALLAGFVASCLAQSLLWVATPGVSGVWGVQKNPSGGFIASAVLIVALSRLPARWRLPALLLLTGGLIASGSRGSIIGLLAGLAVLLLFARRWKRLILPLVSVCLISAAALYLLPAQQVDRLLGRNADGRYTDRVRDVFFRDAMETWDRFPSGVGVGNYQQSAGALQNINTRDPHNVFALQLVEGSWPLLAAFSLLAVGSIIWLMRHQRSDVALLGLTVQLSTLAHAWVDVYWVRGTPSLGWLLVGAAAGAVAARKSAVPNRGTADRSEPESAGVDRGSHRQVAKPGRVGR